VNDSLNGTAATNSPELKTDLHILLLAQKTELMAEITRATANEFNNTMMAITSYAELEMRNASPSQRRSLERVLSNVGRATTLVQKLLAFSNRQAHPPQPLDLNQLIAGIGNLLEQLTGDHISLVYKVDKNIPPVLAEVAEIEQVALSLSIIARNAMRSGGELTISTSVVDIKNESADISDAESEGRYVALSVADTGSGAVADEPADNGGVDLRVNLSLAAVRGVVKNACGFVRIKREREKGSNFTIYLPALQQTSLEHSPPAHNRIASASRTLLVVEDDDAVRIPTSEFLKMEGFKVLQARTGEEAIHVAQQNRSPLDVLITDIVMPKMTGQQVAAKLLELHSDLKVLYMSGDTEAQALRLAQSTPNAILRKPFRLETLKDRIQELLGGEQVGIDD
jgi:CheY-like chemotaxis protein